MEFLNGLLEIWFVNDHRKMVNISHPVYNYSSGYPMFLVDFDGTHYNMNTILSVRKPVRVQETPNG